MLCGGGSRDEDEGIEGLPAVRDPSARALPARPKLAEPVTPAGLEEAKPAFNRAKLSTTSGSVSSVADSPMPSPAPSRVRFR